MKVEPTPLHVEATPDVSEACPSRPYVSGPGKAQEKKGKCLRQLANEHMCVLSLQLHFGSGRGQTRSLQATSNG